jgi:hypothetical protein
LSTVNKCFSGIKDFQERNSERGYICVSNQDGLFIIANLSSIEKHEDFQAITVFMHTPHGKDY